MPQMTEAEERFLVSKLRQEYGGKILHEKISGDLPISGRYVDWLEKKMLQKVVLEDEELEAIRRHWIDDKRPWMQEAREHVLKLCSRVKEEQKDG